MSTIRSILRRVASQDPKLRALMQRSASDQMGLLQGGKTSISITTTDVEKAVRANIHRAQQYELEDLDFSRTEFGTSEKGVVRWDVPLTNDPKGTGPYGYVYTYMHVFGNKVKVTSFWEVRV